jgi:methyltransferase (TIGR00027 family)
MFKELKRVVYQVDDVEKARDWYVGLLGLEPVLDAPVACIFRIGGNTLSLARAAEPAVPQQARVTAFWEVDNVDAAYARLLDLGARAKVAPTDVLTVRTAQVVDPFGNVLAVCGPVPHDARLGIEKQPSQTAQAVALCRALMALDERAEIHLADPFSELFVAPEVRSAIQDAAKRRGLIDTRISRPLYGYFAARSRFIDEAFLRALRAGIPQIVLLGAGFDTRALRFQADLGTTRVFELDAPSTQGRKLELLRSSGTAVPSQVRFVSINFKTGDLMRRLREAGHDSALPTLFIWEGVVYYLPQETVDQTLDLLSKHCAPGSAIAFDYMTEKLESISAGEPMLSWMAPAEMPGYLQRHGFRLIDDLGGPEMARRYLTLNGGTPAEKPLATIRLAYAEWAGGKEH